MSARDKQLEQQFIQRLEKALAALLSREAQYHPSPFLLVDLRDGYCDCSILFQAADNSWQRQAVYVKSVFVDENPDDYLGKFALTLVRRSSRWRPALRNVAERYADGDRLLPPVLDRVLELPNPLPMAQEYLQNFISRSIGEIDSHYYERVVLLVNNDQQRQLLEELIPLLDFGRAAHPDAWTYHSVLTMPESPSIAYAAIQPLDLINGYQPQYLVIGDLGAKQYIWSDTQFSERKLTPTSRIDLSDFTGMLYVTADARLKSNGRIRVLNSEEARSEATARYILYQMYRYPLLIEELTHRKLELDQALAELQREIERQAKLHTRLRKIINLMNRVNLFELVEQ